MKPIPIASAKLIALDYGYDQVVIIARKVGDGGGEYCTTYGVDKANCHVAARIGDFLKFKVMGWAAEHVKQPTPPRPCRRCGGTKEIYPSGEKTICPDCAPRPVVEEEAENKP